jgi:DNA-binding NarL/FixJ family response regulator
LNARILIVDDHHASRITIRELLNWHSFHVCGDAQNGKEAIEKVVELKPDIVLLDINMPVMSGITAATEIRRIAPTTKIVFLTIHDGPGFKAGTKLWAHGFVPKSAAGTDLIPTLQRVAEITANEKTIECLDCKVMQKIHVAARTGFVARTGSAQIERQYISCLNCATEFEVSVRSKIVAGRFTA